MNRTTIYRSTNATLHLALQLLSSPSLTQSFASHDKMFIVYEKSMLMVLKLEGLFIYFIIACGPLIQNKQGLFSG